jgi:phenylacetate-CoA ligase
MGFFHLRSVQGAAWPPLPPSDVSQVWAAYHQLSETQWLPAAQLEELQLQQLRVLLRHCYQHVPYYRQVLTEAGLATSSVGNMAEFRRLPLLTRDLYQAHFLDLQARLLPPGMSAGEMRYTSGTNGVPIKVLSTDRVVLWWNAFYLRDLEWCGIDPRGRLAAIRLLAMTQAELPSALEGKTAPYWNRYLQPLIEMGPAYGMDIRQDPRRQMQWLQRMNPHCLLSMPSNLEFLTGLVEQSGARLPELRVIQSMGEAVSPESRRRIESAFAVPLRDTYSSTEAGYLASPCPSGTGFHAHSENAIVEILDSANQPCLPGQTGRLVLTTLNNFLTPFIRYDIVDEVTLAPEPCPCGRGLPLWTHVEGRRLPLLHLAGERRKSPLGIMLGIRKAGGVHQFQIVQRAVDHVIVRVVPDRTWRPALADRIRALVREECASPIQVDVEEREHLERSPGGKLRIVVIELAP